MPRVVGVVSPYTARGAVQVSRDRRTAFAIVLYPKRANQLPDGTGKPVLAAVKAPRPALQVAAGGQVIEQAEGSHRAGHRRGRDRRTGDPADHVRSLPPPGCR